MYLRFESLHELKTTQIKVRNVQRDLYISSRRIPLRMHVRIYLKLCRCVYGNQLFVLHNGIKQICMLAIHTGAFKPEWTAETSDEIYNLMISLQHLLVSALSSGNN